MGVVVPFPSREARKGSRRRVPVEGGGQILLYTGVRYERYGTPSPATTGSREPRRRA